MRQSVSCELCCNIKSHTEYRYSFEGQPAHTLYTFHIRVNRSPFVSITRLLCAAALHPYSATRVSHGVHSHRSKVRPQRFRGRRRDGRRPRWRLATKVSQLRRVFRRTQKVQPMPRRLLLQRGVPARRLGETLAQLRQGPKRKGASKGSRAAEDADGCGEGGGKGE